MFSVLEVRKLKLSDRVPSATWGAKIIAVITRTPAAALMSIFFQLPSPRCLSRM